jgi:hypothetical protein
MSSTPRPRRLEPAGILERYSRDRASSTLAIAAFCVRCKCPTGMPEDSVEDEIRSCKDKACHWYRLRPYQCDVKPFRREAMERNMDRKEPSNGR